MTHLCEHGDYLWVSQDPGILLQIQQAMAIYDRTCTMQ